MNEKSEAPSMFDDKTILITGGTGSFGNQFIKTVLSHYKVRKIIVYSRDEYKQSQMQSRFQRRVGLAPIRFFLGDVRDKERLRFAIGDGVDYIVHAAALKQVPAIEYNPFEAVKTNILGSQNVIDVALEGNVPKVIALSTDKACAPANLYGATKLASDKLFIAGNNYAGEGATRFSVVRYGNVMGSRGSVIPLFLEQKRINDGLTVTDPRMTRFNITLKQGVDFVIDCLSRMLGGELFVPKMPSVRVKDIATAVAPEQEQKIVGLRDGEKMHEELISVHDAGNAYEFAHHYNVVPRSHYNQYAIEDYREGTAEGWIGPVSPEFSYNSLENTEYLTVEQIRQLILDNVSEAGSNRSI